MSIHWVLGYQLLVVSLVIYRNDSDKDIIRWHGVMEASGPLVMAANHRSVEC